MHIQKLTNDTNPMVTIIFGDTKEYKDYVKEITNINKQIIAEPTIAIAEETLSDMVTLLKKVAKKKKDTGEVFVTLSGAQLVAILPFLFGMVFLRTNEIQEMESKTNIPKPSPSRQRKTSKQTQNLRDDMVRLCAVK